MTICKPIRKRNLYKPGAKVPFRLSRFRLEQFIRCPRCFYLDRKLGVEQPGMLPFTLNNAVDTLLKKEFDIYRTRQQSHPLMERFGIDMVPFAHPCLDEWRENFKGLKVLHAQTNLMITGAVDDIWIDKNGILSVVDYKATSTNGPISMEADYRQGYLRQMEIYQWLLRKMNFDVSDIGFFVYCNADKSKGMFSGKLEFGMEILPYQGNDQWVEGLIIKAHECLNREKIPEFTQKCSFCEYLQQTDLVQGDLFL